MRESLPTADDDNYNFLLYDFAMLHDINSLRERYRGIMEGRSRKTDNDLLRELGYSEEDIAMNIAE